MKLSDLKIGLMVDTAEPQAAEIFLAKEHVVGITTNPSLMAKVCPDSFVEQAQYLAALAYKKPISIEVLADDPAEILRQARLIASWGENVYVKVPVVNSRGDDLLPLIGRLTCDGIKVNVTAIMGATQMHRLKNTVCFQTPCIFSLFAGRLADRGINAKKVAEVCRATITNKRHKLLWASTREVWNIVQAERAGFDYITVSPELLAKAEKLGQWDEHQASVDVVRQFKRDADASGFSL